MGKEVPCFIDSLIYNEKYSGDVNSNNLDNLIFTIFQSGIKTISPNNLKRDFGIIDKNNKLSNNDEVLELAKYLFKILLDENKLNPRTLLIYTEWEKMFRLAESDNGKHQDILDRREVFTKIFGEVIDIKTEYKAFFILHTTLSIIIKLFLTRAICDKINIDDFYKTESLITLKDFFVKLENGKYFHKIGILNLTDNDFFSWYVKEVFTHKMGDYLRKIIFKICSYENINIINNTLMLDLFKELYQNFIPKCVRHSFGEYYTPYWLAERAFLSATAGVTDFQHKTFIDPNCGSGTFLSVFFNYKHKQLDKKIDFQDFVKGIVGIDINPIAVLMARANILFQGLQKCNFNLTRQYEIPVYLADSLYIPKTIIIDDIECLDYKLNTSGLQETFSIDTLQIILPKELIVRDDFLEIINRVERHIVKLDETKAYEEFLSCFSQKVRQSKKIQEKMATTIKELVKFEAKKLNSIWLKIFSNYFKVAIFDKFDYIVGNPAWVQWSVLPQSYRNNIKDNMRLEGLFSNDKNVGGNNLNICALIANKSCERWLKDDGSFCFLMPKSILFNKSFEGFRKLIINSNARMYFNEILDFSQGGEIFEGVGIDFCAFKITKHNINEEYISLIHYEKNMNIKEPLTYNKSWCNIKQHFSESRYFAIQINTKYNNNFLIAKNIQRAKHLKSLIGECEYHFRKGVNVKYPMRLKFVNLAKDTNNGIFSPYVKNGKRLSVNENHKIELELKYLKPFITAPMLEKGWENDYCICPYEYNQKKPITIDNLKKNAPLTFKYLKDNEELLECGSEFNKRVQNFNEFYGILRMGSYIYGNVFVCIRDNTKLSPCIITTRKTHWNHEITPLFDNHISYISEVLNCKG